MEATKPPDDWRYQTDDMEEQHNPNNDNEIRQQSEYYENTIDKTQNKNKNKSNNNHNVINEPFKSISNWFFKKSKK